MSQATVDEREDVQLPAQVLRAAATLVPLKSLRPSYLEDLFTKVQVQYLFPGQTLFEAGSYDNQHLYLLYGQVELQFSDGSTETVSGDSSQFPLAPAVPRRCSAVAKSDCGLLRIDPEHMDRMLSWSETAQFLMAEIAVQRDYDEDYSWMQTVLNSNLFFKVPPVNLEQVFARLKPMVVLKGEAIIRQGEIGNCCYFIKEGTASVTRQSVTAPGSSQERAASQSQAVHLADIGIGRCFGEDALINETVRNANVTMTSDGVLMRLKKNDFMLLLKEPEVTEVPHSELEAQTILVDVRTEEEYSAGHLERAANIPLHLLCVKKRLLTADKTYVFYCDTGRRSRAAAYLLGREGYQTAALKGGLLGMESDTPAAAYHQDYIIRDGESVSGQ